MPPKLTEEDARQFMRDHNFEPTTPYPLTRNPWPGYCLTCGQPGKPTHSEVKLGRSPCKYCSPNNKRTDSAILVGKMLGASWDVGDNPFPGVAKPWAGVCLKCGEHDFARYRDVQRLNLTYACSYCNGSKVHPKKARAVMEARNFKPSIPFPGAGHPWPGVCKTCKQPGSPRYSTVNIGFGPCEYCAKVKVDSAILIGKMMAQDFFPSVPYPGKAVKPWAGVCHKCGRYGNPLYNAVQGGGAACSFCSGSSPDESIRLGKMLALGFEPHGPYPGKATLDWHGTCTTCSRELSVKWIDIQAGYPACRRCNPNKIGFKTGEPGFLYLIRGEKIMKIGISSTPKARIACHRNFANTTLELWVGVGADILQVERLIKRALNSGVRGFQMVPGTKEQWYIDPVGEEIESINDLVRILTKRTKGTPTPFRLSLSKSRIARLSGEDTQRTLRQPADARALCDSYVGNGHKRGGKRTTGKPNRPTAI